MRRLWHARCTATSDDEHAVSTATDGPRRSRKYDSRLAMMLSAPPVSVHTSTRSRSCDARYPYSLDTRSGEDPGLRAPQRIRGDARVLQRFTGDLQQQPLLRIHLGGFARRDVEELRVEGVEVDQGTTPHRVVLASAAATSGDPSSNASHRSAEPTPIARAALTQELPQRFWPSRRRRESGNPVRSPRSARRVHPDPAGGADIRRSGSFGRSEKVPPAR